MKNVSRELGVVNPYSDSKVLYGDTKAEVKNVLVGIDIDVQELRKFPLHGLRVDVPVAADAKDFFSAILPRLTRERKQPLGQ